MSLQTIPDAEVVEFEPVPYEQLGRPIRGPRALTGDWGRMWHLTVNLAIQNWKLRFFGSFLGYLWQLIRPLMLFGVLYVFFTVVEHVQSPGPAGRFYGTQLLGSIVLFTYFQECTFGAVRGIVDSEAMVRKIQFPRIVIPCSNVLLATFNLAGNLIVVLVFGLIQGVRPMFSWVELPLILGLLFLLCLGLSMLLSALFVYFRDLQPIWEVLAQILFYASPVIIPIETVRAKLSPGLVHIYMSSPVATCLQQFRHAMVNHAAVSAGAAVGGQFRLAAPILVVLVILALGFFVFNRVARSAAEDL